MAVATPLHLTRRRTGGVQRVMAAMLGVLVLVLGPLATHHHLAAQVHTTCEHGAEVHVDAAPQAWVPDVAGSLAFHDRDAPSGDADHGGHHHCTATASAVATPPAQPSTTIATAIAGALAPPRVATSVRAAALFRLAPKTSPPV